MREGQTLFTYLHLAASKPCTEALLDRKVTGIAYETVELPDRSLPLLAPMSEVAGRLAPQVGAHTLMRAEGGRGILMGGVSGVYAAKVVVIGAGVSGMNAAAIALGMQAEVLLLDRNIAPAARRPTGSTRATCRPSRPTPTRSSAPCLDADMVIGAVLVPGAKAPKLVTQRAGRRGCGRARCWSTSRSTRAAASRTPGPTTHADPTYKVHNSVFYCVANMPGAVPHTSTYALTNVTLPYAVELANRGWRDALRADHALALGPEHPRRADHLRPGRRGARGAGRSSSTRCSPEPRAPRSRSRARDAPAAAGAADLPRPPGRRAGSGRATPWRPTAATCAATSRTWRSRRGRSPRSGWPRRTSARSWSPCARGTRSTRRWPRTRPPGRWSRSAASTGSCCARAW